MKKKVLSLMLALTFTFSSLLPATSLADNKKLNVRRIAGGGRYETAVEASKKTFERSKYAVVASGEKFADALVGGTLATQIEAPVLLVNKNSVPSVVITEIKRLEVEKVYLLGGTSTVTSTVENSLKQLGVSVERLAGRNKAYTAQEIAKARAKHLGIDTNWTEFAAIDANNYADALSAAPFVSQLNDFIPLIPIEKGNTSSAHTVAFGGTNSVTKSTAEKKRYAGSNREGTAVEIAKAYEEELNKEIDTVVLVHGYDYPDALASAPVASMNNGVILLTNSKTLSKETKSFIDNNDNIKNVIIVGGENSVSKNIERELRGETATPIIPNENNKPNSSNTWEVDGKWKLTIDSVKSTTERNEFADTNPEEVIIIKYSYENIGYNGNIQDLFLTPTKVIDAKGEMASLYPANITVYPQETPIGAKMIGAEEGFGLNNKSDIVTIIFEYFDENYNLHRFTCKCPITK